jgi:hypothetical protein
MVEAQPPVKHIANPIFLRELAYAWDDVFGVSEDTSYAPEDIAWAAEQRPALMKAILDLTPETAGRLSLSRISALLRREGGRAIEFPSGEVVIFSKHGEDRWHLAYKMARSNRKREPVAA